MTAEPPAPGPGRWWREPDYLVAGGGLVATIVPERGGKIVSLMGPDSREWLTRAAEPALAPARPGAGFTDAEMAGWDECAPSIVDCEIEGRPVPDHGDLWTQPWNLQPCGPNENACSVTGTSLNYRLTRRISGSTDALRIDYRAQALDAPLPFLWAAHPQFVAPAGSRVQLQEQVGSVYDVLVDTPRRLRWSPDLASIDTVEPGGCRKVYVDPDTRASQASLIHPDEAELTLSWSGACRYLGVWYDAGSYSREPVIALEPATAYFDSLATAVALDRVPVLSEGHPLEWTLELSATPGKAPKGR